MTLKVGKTNNFNALVNSRLSLEIIKSTSPYRPITSLLQPAHCSMQKKSCQAQNFLVSKKQKPPSTNRCLWSRRKKQKQKRKQKAQPRKPGAFKRTMCATLPSPVHENLSGMCRL